MSKLSEYGTDSMTIGGEACYCSEDACPLDIPEKKEDDSVNHPSHYTQGTVECIDAIESSMTPEEFRGYLKGCLMKYIWRYQHKGGMEDLKKARWYLDRLIKFWGGKV